MKKRFLVWLLAAVCTVNIIGCGDTASSKYDGAYQTSDYAYDEPAAMERSSSAKMVNYTEEAVAYDGDEMYDMEADTPASANTTATAENASNTNRKLIRDMSLNVETKEYDALIKNLTEEITALGGYIEFMDVRNNSYNASRASSRGASLTARIPAAKLDSFVNKVGETTNITNRTESVRDVTLTYVDMQSHKDMLIAERDRLMEYLNAADTIEDMMAIEDHLTDVRYQIDSMESQLRTYDNMVDYSTVNINVVEVIEYTPVVEPTVEKTTWERISEGFTHSVKDVAYDIKEFFIDLIINLPYILLFIVKVAIVHIILRIVIFSNKRLRNWYNEKKADRKAYRAQKKAEKAAKKAAKKADTEPVLTTGEGAAPENKTEENQ
ncbi:MAG: DUF4349 domain-containing protein [Lachnospiraceae bacterium]|nr:DUF4349 domain-containing protein [Lachnospiraceae bacterium]